MVVSFHPVAATPVFSDTLDSINSSAWSVQITGAGPTVSSPNQSVITTLPANSLDDPQAQGFGGGLKSNCLVNGDFDYQVDFKLLLWPPSSGVRVGLIITDSPTPAVERTDWGPTENPTLPRQVYLMDFGGNVQGIAATTDLNGTLRMVRTGSILSGYHLSPNGWVLIAQGSTVNVGPIHFGFSAWSHNVFFAGEEVKVGFNNFVINSGQLLCPSLKLNPASGPVGTKVQVQALGFPVPIYGPDQVLMSFDGNLLGFATNANGGFSFTFDVPDAQPGPHLVVAIDGQTQTSMNASFIVTRVDTLSVNLDVGTLYFPGDTASIFTLASLSGTPVNSTTLQLQLTLTRPDGSNTILASSFLGSGLFKAVYTIPKTGPIGTYALVAKAHVGNVQDQSALATFEVKLPWLAAQGPAMATAAVAVTGIAAVAAVTWRRGFFRSKTN
jgi:hypothetical protein